jgi:hypothetical protein
MIVSHRHKLIFLKAKKVAGTSFEIALSRFLDETDIITPVSRDDEAIRAGHGFIGARNFNFGFVRYLTDDIHKPYQALGMTLPPKFYNHIPAKAARSRLETRIWKEYQKISIVRNPWDRAVSIFFWRNSKRKNQPKLENFSSYFKDNPELLQTNYALYMINGANVIDTYFRYEHLEEDILDFEVKNPALTGLWETFNGINAKGATRDRTLTSQEIFAQHPAVDAQIRKLNAWEIDRFGYRLE